MNLLTRNSSIIFKGKQHINHMFITNLVITIVTNDDPFYNNAYKWYMSQDVQNSPKHKEETHVRYKYLVLTVQCDVSGHDFYGNCIDDTRA
jgi:hypothetical protein